MAMKYQTQFAGDLNTVKVYFDDDIFEYRCAVMGNPDADYFTDDRADAFQTARIMAGLPFDGSGDYYDPEAQPN